MKKEFTPKEKKDAVIGGLIAFTIVALVAVCLAPLV